MNPHAPAALAFLALLFVAAPASAASFDCAKAGTAVEHMICDDAELSKLDGLLSDRYVRARAKTEDAKALRTEQRAWLRNSRDACADAGCLKDVYRARIAELTAVGWMTADKAWAICDAVRDAANTGELRKWARQYKDLEEGGLAIDYDDDGKAETLISKSLIVGKCSRQSNYITDKALQIIPQAGFKHEDWGWEGLPEKFITVDGEPIVVWGYYNDPYRPGVEANIWRTTAAAWLGPDGRMRKLCSFAHGEGALAKTVQDYSRSLCQAARWLRVPFAAWSNAAELEGDLGETARRFGAHEVLEFDLDMDGVAEIISRRRFAYSSCRDASIRTYLTELDIDRKDIARSALNEILQSRDWGPIESTDPAWQDPGMFMFNGRPYILTLGYRTRSMDYSPPEKGDTDAAVYSLWNGRLTKMCGYELYARHEIERMIPVPPPDAE